MIAEDSSSTQEWKVDLQVDELTQFAARQFPKNIDEVVKATGALGFHPSSKIHSGIDLLHLILVYALTGLSMEGTTDAMSSVVSLSAPAFLGRLRRSTRFLATLLSHLLATSIRPAPTTIDGLTVMLLDGWSASDQSAEGGANANATKHHVLLAMSLADLTIRQIIYDLNRPNTGESYKYVALAPDQLWINDASFTGPSAFDLMEQSNCYMIGYFYPGMAISLDSKGDDCIKVANFLTDKLTEPGQIGEWTVWIHSASRKKKSLGRRPVRLIAKRVSDAAEARRYGQRIHKKGSLEPAMVALDRFVIVLTNLEVGRGTPEQILALYRMRWQIELELKRHQSVIDLRRIPTRTRASTQAWLMAKLLATVLVHRMLDLAEERKWEDAVGSVPDLDVAQLNPNPLSGASRAAQRELESRQPKSSSRRTHKKNKKFSAEDDQKREPEQHQEPVMKTEEPGQPPVFTAKAMWPARIWKWGWRVLLNLLLSTPILGLDDAFEALRQHLPHADTPKRRRRRSLSKLVRTLMPDLEDLIDLIIGTKTTPARPGT